MKKPQDYTTKKIKDFEFSEIDFYFYDELFGKKWDDEKFEHPRCISSEKNNEGYPIKIERLIQKLQQFKDKGANYVSIDYHCDHIGYQLEFLNIQKSTPEEILNYKTKELKKKEIKNKF